MVDSVFSLTVDAVVVPNAVVGNADVTPDNGAVVPLVVSTNNVGDSADDSVVLDVLPVVVFASLVSVKGDDASVIVAAVVGANVDSVVPDALNVAIAADKELVSASVVGFIVTLLAVLETSEVRSSVVGANVDSVVPDAFNVAIPADEELVSTNVVGSCVTLLAVLDTSEVRATVSGFTEINVVISFWADGGSFVPCDATSPKVEALGAVADSSRTVVVVTVSTATDCKTEDET